MPGSKRERSPGKWTLTVTLGTDYRGKQRRFNKTFHGSAAEAEKALALFYAECASGKKNRSTEETISDLVNAYINDRPEGSLKQNTIAGYKQHFRLWIEPYIGDIKFRKATPKKLQGWVNDLSEFLSPKSIRNAVGLLSASFAYGVKLDMIATNPCANIILPKNERKEAEYYNEDEVLQFLAALEDLDGEDLTYKVLFELALFCGFRKSELLGIEMQDVDLTECTIKIRQTRYSGGGGESRYDTPKTLKSLRTVSFPAAIKPAIIKLMSHYSDRAIALGNEWHASTALFRGPYGKPIPSTQPLKKLHSLQEKYGLKKITLHQLRHTNVSLMISMGLDIKTIQERGGYSNSSTPLNIYGHLFKNQDARIAQDLYDAVTKTERATNVRQK